MAYKFQVGPAILSGSTTFEDAISAASVASVGASTAATLSASAGISGASVSADGAGSFGDLAVGTNKLVVNDAGVITLGGAIDETVSVSADSFYFRDADGSLKRESLADYAALIAGDGLAASGGVLALGVDDSTIETNADALRLKDAGITLAKMAANSVDSDQYVDGSIDLIHMSADSVDSDQYVDGSIDLVHMSANSVDSDQYVDGSIDLIHMSANSVDSDQYVDGSIDTDHLADDQVTLAKMAGLARGKFIIGDSNGDPGAMPLGTAHQFLQSDGTDLSYVSLSGDATLAAGVLTISANAVQTGMVHDDVATELAGAGLSAASGVMALDIDELSALGSAALHQTEDYFAFSDDGTEKKVSFSNLQDAVFADVSGDATVAAGGALTIGANAIQTGMVNDDVATELAGDGLAAASGVLSVRVDDSGIETDSDILRLKDNGVTLAKMAGLARGKFIIGDSNGDPGAMPLGSAHQFLQSDGTDLAYVSLSGDATLAAGVLTISANAIQTGMVHDDVATELAGAGLSAASGVLSVTGNNVAAKADGDTLAEGYNIFAAIVAAATVTLPASPAVGDTVTVKGMTGVSQTNYIQINKAGSQTIDGQGSIRIESEYGAVTMVYVASNDWRLV
tara:strand:+ start:2053 stop:3930 length:1878 start_codon:yes stop_codon:yes gene_type:complete